MQISIAKGFDSNSDESDEEVSEIENEEKKIGDKEANLAISSNSGEI